jgi:hypothetical protein
LLSNVGQEQLPRAAIETSGPSIVACLAVIIYLSLSALDTVLTVVPHGYQVAEKLVLTPVVIIGIEGQDDTNVSSRMLKMAVQQGRSERRGEAYASVR